MLAASVTDPLDSVLAELEQFGKANDASTTERARRMLNITRDTGEFLAVTGQSDIGSARARDWYVKWLFDAVARERRTRDWWLGVGSADCRSSSARKLLA